MLIEIKSSPYGRGVFAKRLIKKGTIIEVCPIILLPDLDNKNELEDQLERFQFNWVNGLKCIALGFGSIYNHSEHPNAIFLPNFEEKTITFVALKDIEAEDEILTDYGYVPVVGSSIEKQIEQLSNVKSFSHIIIKQTIQGLQED